MFAVQAQGKDIRTIEGLGTPDNLHPLQRAFIAHHALQCGFCTPGMIMAAVDLIETYPGPLSEAVVREEMEGNLYRCTGYHNIVKAVLTAAETVRGGAQ